MGEGCQEGPRALSWGVCHWHRVVAWEVQGGCQEGVVAWELQGGCQEGALALKSWPAVYLALALQQGLACATIRDKPLQSVRWGREAGRWWGQGSHVGGC